MSQIFLPENIPSLVKASSTTVTLAATNLGQPTSINVGGQSYRPSATLTLNAATVGANGLDAGSLGASQLWYVYAIVNQSTQALALVASLNAPSTGPAHPTGYGTAERWIGSFITDASNAIAYTMVPTNIATATTSQQLGLLQAGAIPGVIDGSSASAGYVGQVINLASTSVTTLSTSAWLANPTPMATITAGIWLVAVTCSAQYVASMTGKYVGISSNTTANNSGMVVGYFGAVTPASNYTNHAQEIPLPTTIVNLTVDTPVYLKVVTYGAVGTTNCNGIAVRIR